MLFRQIVTLLMPLAAFAAPGKPSSTTTTTTTTTKSTTKSTTTSVKPTTTTTTTTTTNKPTSITTTTRPITTTTTTTKPATTTVNAAFCSVNNNIISLLKLDAVATSYCSSYLSISPKTYSTTSTITPSSTTVTTTITLTPVNVVVTKTDTITNNVVATTTITTFEDASATTTQSITCFTSASYASTTTVQKRNNIDRRAISKPTCLPTTWVSPAISSACSCLSIPTPSTTITSFTNLPQGTVTVTSTVTPAAVTNTVHVSSATTITVSTSTVTVTSTTTSYSTTTTVVASGMYYRQYHNPDPHIIQDEPGPYRHLDELRGLQPISEGIQPNVNFNYDQDFVAYLNTGYFIAPQSGVYNFHQQNNNGHYVDDWDDMWVGDSSYAWNNDTTFYKAWEVSYDSTYFQGSNDLTLNAGDVIPMTLLNINGGGPGMSSFLFTTPDGIEHTDTTGYFAPPCTDGNPFIY